MLTVNSNHSHSFFNAPLFIFIGVSLLLHISLSLLAYRTGGQKDLDVTSIPTTKISMILVEPQKRNAPKPPPRVKEKAPPIKKVISTIKAPTKVLQKTKKITQKTTKKIVKKANHKPLTPQKEQLASSPIPVPYTEKKASFSPQPIYRPKPKYPMIAKRRGIEGTVVLDISLAADGRVSQAIVIESSGSSALDRSALQTVKSWRFPASPFNSLSSFKQRITFQLNKF